MAKTRTIVDADVLINGFRGIGVVAGGAQAIIDDPDREFVVSYILRLELIPKPHFFGRSAEEQFYEDFFAAAVECVETTPTIIKDAETEAKACGLAAADALQVTAAKRSGAQEFITAEKQTSSLFRVTGRAVISLRLWTPPVSARALEASASRWCWFFKTAMQEAGRELATLAGGEATI